MSKSVPMDECKIVSIARIAAELQSVMSVARGVSLAAKNAMVMSAQAGEKARGFQPVTGFINEISEQAIMGVKEINNEALQLSHITVSEERARDANEKFLSVFKKNKEALYIDSLADALIAVNETMKIIHADFNVGLKRLVNSLESMDECMKSARCVASVARIVISDTQEFRESLKDVADNLDKAAEYIKEKINQSYNHLANVKLLGVPE